MVQRKKKGPSKPRDKGRKKNIKWTDELFYKKVLKPISEGQTIMDIARSLKLTRQSVTLRLKAYGINNKAEAMQEIIRSAKEGNPV